MNRRSFVVSTTVGALAALPASRAVGSPLVPAFQFSNGYWINLHHTLFYQMQALENAYQRAPRVAQKDKVALADLRTIPAAHEAEWYQALQIYHRHYAHSDFVFDDVLRLSDETLSAWSADARSAPPEVPKEMATALNLAAPIYSLHLWPTHQAQNATYANNLQSLLATYGNRFRAQLPKLYGTPWLDQPYRVDIVAYSDSDGSYCNNATGYVHIVMSSCEADNLGAHGLDVLFHEASHSIASPFDGTIGGPIVAAAAQLNRPVPDQFWHTVLMYTPGRIAEDVFNASALRPYTMVWVVNGLFTDVWPQYYAVLEQHWQPYMDGKTDRVGALTSCVEAIVNGAAIAKDRSGIATM